MALSGLAMGADITLDMKDVSYDGSPTLTSGNKAMSWETGASYTNWYIEFTLSTVTATGYKPTITAGPFSNSGAQGLSACAGNITVDDVTETKISIGNNANLIENSPTLAFATTDTLTFAYYDGIAYIGNKTQGEYIALEVPDITTTMTSGTSRAWANNNTDGVGTTQIVATTIAGLDNLGIEEGYTLDMRTLMTTGKAQTIALPVPEPTTATLSLLALAGLASRRRRR